ncbi:hypothetical protein K437DRAFT_73960 [Tilletiaria anomala UBC 951]|uniref:Uncharacterized protein n=1 Tax=Tilletiaria anomala (strain ATCC 24038 / CBS 436.72 / UBC 951) TaxID=1037660 RepID=A0A066WFT5_TILAU|nr:uncharacterized protein K437DRAFT_73960 [Tilletiaria anomala UBC 951]KDN49924.1 hypothetical protein K437DRAFT_73960 [Tilletiaria anomala UBC 951]
MHDKSHDDNTTTNTIAVLPSIHPFIHPSFDCNPRRFHLIAAHPFIVLLASTSCGAGPSCRRLGKQAMDYSSSNGTLRTSCLTALPLHPSICFLLTHTYAHVMSFYSPFPLVLTLHVLVLRSFVRSYFLLLMYNSLAWLCGFQLDEDDETSGTMCPRPLSESGCIALIITHCSLYRYHKT